MWIVRITCASGSEIVVQTVLDVTATCPSFPLETVLDFVIISQPDQQPSAADGSAAPGSIQVKDEFFGGDFASGNIGDLGWISDSLTLFPSTAQPNHPGMIGFYSLSQLGSLYLTPQNSAPVSADWFFDCTFVVFMLINNNTTGIRLGLMNSPTDEDTSGIFVEKDLLDTNFFGVTKQTSFLETRVDLQIPTATGWHSFRVRRKSVLEIAFSIDGGAEFILNSTIPTFALKPALQINGLIGVQAVFLDYFACNIYNMER